ncbi:MAG: type II toxin-antitoxin system HicA family toxin [Candidatus Scalindua sp.]|nr:type II toxin-antitoxin system HicA family toxin [Candidatus Scalindua sp.]
MPKLKPCLRRILVRKLKEFGFKGPYSGGKHSWMEKENIRLIIPNPHKGDIDVGLIRRILKQAKIRPEEWNKL